MKEERLVLSSGWSWRFRPEAGTWLRRSLPAIAELRQASGGELLKETGRRRAIFFRTFVRTASPSWVYSL